MKALYVPLTLLAAILAFSLWAGRYVDQRTEETVALLERASEAGLQEDWEAAAESLTQASSVWEARQNFFHTILKHDELDEAESLFAGAEAACRETDQEEFHILLAQLVSQLEHLAETQAVNLRNIL